MRQAVAPEVAERARELHRLLPKRKLILGVDRLDYTKGIPLRLKAFQNLLARFPGAARAGVVHPGRRAQQGGNPAVPGPEDGHRAAGEQDQRQLRAPWRLGAGLVRLPQPVAARPPRVLPRRRHRSRHAAPRRHEPGGEGILRVQHRGGLHAHTLGVRGRGGAARQDTRCSSTLTTSRGSRTRYTVPTIWGRRSARRACVGCGARSGSTTCSGGWIPFCKPPSPRICGLSRSPSATLPTNQRTIRCRSDVPFPGRPNPGELV